jgi:putative PIN family toxin of toxin-antitoxin system
MRLVLDTNVFISGVFFSGPPYEILDAWRRGQIELVVSPEILAEYQRTAEELSGRFAEVDLTPWLELLILKATVVEAPSLPEYVCTDTDDDKFLACALASRTKVIASGDKALRRTSGYKGIEVLTPRQFVEQHLSKRSQPKNDQDS